MARKPANKQTAVDLFSNQNKTFLSFLENKVLTYVKQKLSQDIK